MTEETKTRLWNAIIGLIVAVSTAITIVATSWQTQHRVDTKASETQSRVKKSENLIQATVKQETAAVTTEAAKVAVDVAEKVAEAKAEEVAAPQALEERIEKLEAEADK